MEPIVAEGWEGLATVPIAVAVSLTAVQFAKLFIHIGTRGWQRLSAVVAVVVMVGATLAGGPDPFALTLAVVNGLIAGVAASRTFDAVRDLADRQAAGREVAGRH